MTSHVSQQYSGIKSSLFVLATAGRMQNETKSYPVPVAKHGAGGVVSGDALCLVLAKHETEVDMFVRHAQCHQSKRYC